MSSKGEKKAEADAGVAELGAPAGALRCQVYGQAFGRLKLSKKDLQVRTSLVCICAGGANSKSGPLVPPTLVPLQPWRWLKLKVARLRSRPVMILRLRRYAARSGRCQSSSRVIFARPLLWRKNCPFHSAPHPMLQQRMRECSLTMLQKHSDARACG